MTRCLALLLLLVTRAVFAADVNGFTARYERVISSPPPPCSTVISSANHPGWASLNNSSHRIICLAPGDYSSLGKITLTASGSPGNERWFRYYSASDDGSHPVHQPGSNRAKVHRIEFDNANYWIIHRLTVDMDGANAPGVFFPPSSNSDNNILDTMLIQNGAGGNNRLVVVKKSNDNNTIQNSVIRDTKVAPDEDNECVEIDGGATGIRIVNNEIYDCNKPIAIKTSAPGAIIENNDLYNSPARFTDCNGNYTPHAPNSPCSVGEAMISMKGAGTSSNPVLITYNRMWGARPSDGICCLASSSGAAVTLSESDGVGEATYAALVHNIIGESQIGITQPREGPHHNSIIGNLIYQIRRFNSANTSTALNVRKGTHTEWYFNTITESDVWLDIESSATSNDILCNVVLNGGSQSGTAGTGTVVDYNAFYNSSPYTTRAPGHDVVEGDVSAAKGLPYCFYRKLLTGPERVCLANVLSTRDSPHYQACDPDVGSRNGVGIN